MSERTVRGMVMGIQRECLAGNMQPDRTRELLIQATALIGNANAEVHRTEIVYNRVLLKHLDGEEAANRATIRAKTTDEYGELHEARNIKELCLELKRSLSKVLTSIDEEMRLAR